jgi:hypothetical protein
MTPRREDGVGRQGRRRGSRVSALHVTMASVLTILTAALYGAVAIRYHLQGRAEPSVRLFALFWAGVSVWGFAQAVWSFALDAAGAPLVVGIAALHVKLFAGVAALFGLVSYLVVIGRGPGASSRRAVALLAVGYAALYVALAAWWALHPPASQWLSEWEARIDRTHVGWMLWTLAVVLLYAPPLVFSIVYGLKSRRVDDSAKKQRILGVSAFLGMFFGTMLLAWLEPPGWWGLGEKILALGVVAGVFMTIEAPEDGRVYVDEVAAV